MLRCKKLISSLLAAAIVFTSVEALAAGGKPGGGLSETLPNYSEIVYIKDKNDLLAIDGRSGIYCELENDINISGMEWKPLVLTNSVFDGNGYTINGMTVTKEPEYIKTVYDETDDFEYSQAGTGFLDWSVEAESGSNNVILDLNLTNINIDIAKQNSGELIVNGLGSELNTRCKNCTVSGSISVSDVENYNRSVGSRVLIAELCNSSNSKSEVSVTLDSNTKQPEDKDIYGGYVYGLSGCESCTRNGDIKISGMTSELGGVICNSEKCTSRGNVTVQEQGSPSVDGSEMLPYVYGIYNSSSSTLYGTFKVTTDIHEVSAIAASENSSMIGGITSTYLVTGISRGSNNKFKGSITANDTVYGIRDGEENSFDGNINSQYTVYVIRDGEKNSFNGNVKCLQGAVKGIVDGTDCRITGNVTGSNRSKADMTTGIDGGKGNLISGNVSDAYGLVTGIADSSDSRIAGNVEGDYTYGIDNSSNCYISGSVISGDETTGIQGCYNCHIGKNVIGYQKSLGIWGGASNSVNGAVKTTYDKLSGKNVDWVNGRATGIDGGNNNYIMGDVIANGCAVGIINGIGCNLYGDVNAKHGSATGIENSISCSVSGSVLSRYGDGTMGMYNCTVCSISGSIIEKDLIGYPDNASLTVDANTPYRVIYYCRRCGDLIYTTEYLGDKFFCCYSYNDWGEREENYYHIRNDLNYSYSDSPTDIPHSPDVPDTPGATPMPTPAPVSYAIQVIDEVSREPYIGAKVSVDGTAYTTNNQGIISLTHSKTINSLSIAYNNEVIYSAEDYLAVPDTINVISVGGLNLNVDDIFISNNEQTTLTGPQMELAGRPFNLFELPFGFESDLFGALEIKYDELDKKYQVLLGDADTIAEVKSGGADSPQWQDAWNSMRELTNGAGAAGSKKLPMLNGTFGFDGNISAGGYLELEPVNNTIHLLDGRVYILAECDSSGAVPFAPAPYIFLTFGVSGSIEAGLSLEIIDASYLDPEFNVVGYLEVSVAPRVGVGAGLFKKLSLEIGLEGELELSANFPIRKMEEDIEAALNGKVYAMLNILSYEQKVTKTLLHYPLYPRNNVNALSLMESDDCMTLVSRDYLNNDISLASTDDYTVKTNLYPYSSVKTVLLGDGRTLMVWLDDDAQRSDINRTALFYSVLENGEWSSPAQIENDGTADFDFDLKSNGNTAAIIWQDADSVLNDNTPLSDLSAAVELSYSEFNSDSWSRPEAVTYDNSDYEYSPRLSDVGGYAIWTQNNVNSPIAGTDGAKESIYRAEISESYVPPEKVYDDISLIYESEVGRDGTIAYIADKDGDTATPENCLYIGENEPYGGETTLSGLQCADGAFIFTENGSLKSMWADSKNPVEIYSEGGDNIAYIIDDTHAAAVYEVQNEFTSELHASYEESGEWTNPVQITDFNEKIRSWDAKFDDDGNIMIGAVLADVTVDDDNVTDSVKLVYKKTEPIEDITVTDFYTDGDVVRDQYANFVIAVKNDTKNDISSAKISLKGENISLYEEELYVFVAAGEQGTIRLDTQIPEDFTAQNITASVTVNGLNEANADNNSATAVIGKSDLSVELDGSSVIDTGNADIIISNIGCEDITGPVLTITGENGDQLYSAPVNMIAAGETEIISVPIDEKYYTEYTDFNITAAVKYADTEKSASYRIDARNATAVSLDAESIVLRPGDKYTVKPFFYPKTATAATYVTSDNESIVTVDENGVITAVDYGKATIFLVAEGVSMPAKMTVYIKDLSSPVISSAVYGETGIVTVTADTTACLEENEVEQLITAVYAENNTLLGIDVRDVSANSNVSVILPLGENKPKYAKVMLWSSLSGMKPASLAATEEIVSQ